MNERNILLGDYLGKFGFDYYIEDDSWNGEFKRAIVLVEMEDCEMPQAEDIKRILNKSMNAIKEEWEKYMMMLLRVSHAKKDGRYAAFKY